MGDLTDAVRRMLELKDERIQTLEAENKKLIIQRRGYQIMGRSMVLGQVQAWRAAIDEGKYERAGGDVECQECRLLYVEHPELPGFPTFHILCCGEIVKT